MIKAIKYFETETGIIIPAVTREQMVEIDRIAINVTGPNLFQMMENAGRNLAELTIRVLRNNRKQSIMVLAGTGGNGGGGISSARHLANKGFNVKVCITEPEKLKEVPAYQLHILKYTTAKIISVKDLQNENPDIIIDAIIGYSLSGELKGKAFELIKWADQKHSTKISLDIPSGVNANTGESSKNFIKPDLTLTLALPKTGLLPELSGELFLGDIGIPKKVFEKIGLNFGNVFANSYLIKISEKN